MITINTSKILENIQPFNDIFYRSCFYNSFFPVVKHFRGSIIPFLLNDICFLKEDRNSDIGLSVEYISNQKISQISENNGIFVQAKEKSEDIEADIIAAISNNRPVIIWCDPFYESIRLDAYYKKHLVHTLLVYGYSMGSNEFNIIEHQNYENLSYEYRCLGHKDVIESYNGFIEHFMENKDFKTNLSFFEDKVHGGSSKTPSFMEFYYKDSKVDQNETKRNCLEEFYNNIDSNIGLLMNGVECLEEFIAKYKEIVSDEFNIKERAAQLLDLFNQIINAKKIESYKIALVMGNEKEYSEILAEIEKQWSGIRSVIAKYIFSQNYKSSAFGKTIALLESACCLERKYAEKLMSQL